MSNELFNLALQSNIASASQIAVMMVLANAADDEGVCWPSVDHLMSATRLGRSTVLRALSELEDGGYLVKQRRRAKSSVYTIVRKRLETVQRSRSGTSRSGTFEPEKSQNGTSQSETLSEPNVPQRDFKRSRSGTVLKRTTNRIINSSSAMPADGEDEHPDANEHPDARKLCERLAELMTDRGCKQPTIGKRWLDAARLLLTRDGRDFSEALAVLEWSQADAFWQDNIHSMSKFREKYDQLIGRARKAGALTAKAATPSTPDAVLEWLKQQWRDATTGEIERLAGLRYEQPDLPLGITSKDAVETFFRDNRRDWITQHHETILARLTKEHAA